MNTQDLYQLTREALILILLLSLPILGAALLSGLLVGALSNYTRLSEPAIGHVARVLAVFIVLLFVAPWIGDSVSGFASQAWTLIQSIKS